MLRPGYEAEGYLYTAVIQPSKNAYKSFGVASSESRLVQIFYNVYADEIKWKSIFAARVFSCWKIWGKEVKRLWEYEKPCQTFLNIKASKSVELRSPNCLKFGFWGSKVVKYSVRRASSQQPIVQEMVSFHGQFTLEGSPAICLRKKLPFLRLLICFHVFWKENLAWCRLASFSLCLPSTRSLLSES